MYIIVCMVIVSFSLSHTRTAHCFQVVGLDLQPVINTLQSIQTYCNYDPFKTMRLLGMDINTPPFEALVSSFQPTHAACIIGLLPEETAFLEVRKLFHYTTTKFTGSLLTPTLIIIC